MIGVDGGLASNTGVLFIYPEYILQYFKRNRFQNERIARMLNMFMI